MRTDKGVPCQTRDRIQSFQLAEINYAVVYFIGSTANILRKVQSTTSTLCSILRLPRPPRDREMCTETEKRVFQDRLEIEKRVFQDRLEIQKRVDSSPDLDVHPHVAHSSSLAHPSYRLETPIEAGLAHASARPEVFAVS